MFLNQKAWFSSSVSAQFKIAWENEGGLIASNSASPDLCYFFSFIASERESKRLLSNEKILFSPNWITDSIRSGIRRDPNDYILLAYKADIPRPLPPEYISRTRVIDSPGFSRRKRSLARRRQREFGWSGYGKLNSDDCGRLLLFDSAEVEEGSINDEEREMEAAESGKNKGSVKRKLPTEFGSIPKKTRLPIVSKDNGEEYFEEYIDDNNDYDDDVDNNESTSRANYHETAPITKMTVEHFLDTLVYPNQPDMKLSRDKDILDWVMNGLVDFEPGVDGCTVELSGISRLKNS